MRNAYKNVTGKPEMKKPVRRPKHRWEDSITMGLKDVGVTMWTGVKWLRIGSSGELL
jgi:hypothetical protein